MEGQDFSGAFSHIKEIASVGNQYLAKHEFWNLVKEDAASGRPEQAKLDLLEEVLFVNFEVVRILSLLLLPYCPDTANSMLAILDSSLAGQRLTNDALKFDLSKKI